MAKGRRVNRLGPFPPSAGSPRLALGRANPRTPCNALFFKRRSPPRVTTQDRPWEAAVLDVDQVPGDGAAGLRWRRIPFDLKDRLSADGGTFDQLPWPLPKAWAAHGRIPRIPHPARSRGAAGRPPPMVAAVRFLPSRRKAFLTDANFRTKLETKLRQGCVKVSGRDGCPSNGRRRLRRLEQGLAPRRASSGLVAVLFLYASRSRRTAAFLTI
jgi:hypothetical protein